MNNNDYIKLWRIGLSSVSIINIIYILYYLIAYTNHKHYLLIVLSFLYTLSSGIRGIWPRIDSKKICYEKNPLSTPLVGRTLATVGEISYVALIAIFLNMLMDKYKINKDIYRNILNLCIFFIVMAQMFCWVGVSTGNSIFNVTENSIWTVTAGLILYIIFNIVNNIKNNKMKFYLISAGLGIVGYIIFMIRIDIPMYIKRCSENKDIKVFNMKSIEDMNNCKVDKSYNTWIGEVPWLTGYFTLGVWSSYIMMNLAMGL